MSYKLIFALFLMTLATNSALAQTSIWAEDFTGIANGTNSDAGATAWTSTCVGCATGPPDYEVDNNRFKTYDINTEGVFTTEAIDISGHTNVSISVALVETGPLDNDDYINLYYILVGGAETPFATNGININDFDTRTASQTGLNGSSLVIVIRSSTNQSNERIYFDDILVQGDIALPIALLDFGVELSGDDVILSWSTLTEDQNDYFQVEKSTNGIHWTVIGQVDGQGSSQSLTNYSFVDESRSNGTQYYRLSIYDYDGNAEYSSVKSINLDRAKNLVFSIYPNPADDIVTLKFTQKVDGEISYSLTNIKGQKMRWLRFEN